jgi:hypothetical protein
MKVALGKDLVAVVCEKVAVKPCRLTNLGPAAVQSGCTSPALCGGWVTFHALWHTVHLAGADIYSPVYIVHWAPVHTDFFIEFLAVHVEEGH